jgi:hypothetical protein
MYTVRDPCIYACFVFIVHAREISWYGPNNCYCTPERIIMPAFDLRPSLWPVAVQKLYGKWNKASPRAMDLASPEGSFSAEQSLASLWKVLGVVDILTDLAPLPMQSEEKVIYYAGVGRGHASFLIPCLHNTLVVGTERCHESFQLSQQILRRLVRDQG